MKMRRRNFLQMGAAGTGTHLLNASAVPAASAASAIPPEADARDEVLSVSIREYLTREARAITKGALSSFESAEAFHQRVPERRRQFLEMLGIDHVVLREPRPPLNVQITGTIERPAYRIEKLHYESIPKLYVTANLYIPKPLNAKTPGVLYVCGHLEKMKVAYQADARKFAELGFVCLLIETLEGGDVRGTHHGPVLRGWFHWYSKGYTPGGIEVLNGIRGLDLLAARPEVDSSRLGVTGISGGGAYSWYIPACDERVKVTAPACGTSHLESHVYDLTIDGHCDCMWWTNTYRWDLTSVGALIAPRPMMIASADHDQVFAIKAIHEVHDQLAGLYGKLGASENLRLVVNEGGHGYTPSSRTAIYSWFAQHLHGKNISPEAIGDVDSSPEHQETEETLRVFVNGSPAGNRTLTIQDDFLIPAAAPDISSTSELEKVRRKVIAGLRQKTFAAFPASPPPLDIETEHAITAEHGESLGRFAFTSEAGWRLHGLWAVHDSIPRSAPVVVGLRFRGENRYLRVRPSEELLRQIQEPMLRVVIEPRGTGETAWGDELQWHVRRASAWTGRTLASMWVYDTLRGLQAVRALEHVQGRPVALAASGDMAAVALYAALLDGNVQRVFLVNSPATQNAPSQADGRGAAVEMLSCLRVTDVAQVAGLLFPTELVFVGDCPSTYDWAENLYAKLGSSGRFRRVKEMSEWHGV